MSWDAWHNAKDEKLIRLSCDEKTSKNCWNSTKFDFTQFSIGFERFLSPGWSDLCLVFCIVSGILRHKFRVPTKGTLEDFFFTYKGVCAKIAAHCGRSRWLKKSWKSVHGFINIFPTIYFLGKIIWQLFAKMGHPNVQAGSKTNSSMWKEGQRAKGEWDLKHKVYGQDQDNSRAPS